MKKHPNNTIPIATGSPKQGVALFFLMVWPVVLLLTTTSTYFANHRQGGDFWREIFFTRLSTHMIWFLLAPLIWIVARRWPFETQGWKRRVLIYMLFGLAFCFAYSVLHEVMQGILGQSHFFSVSWGHLVQDHLLRQLPLWFMVYCSILGLCLMIQSWQNAQTQQIKITNMANLLTQAKLSALKMQLHPHFLFNTLNTISSYVERDPEKTRTMIARLSELLRTTLRSEEAQQVSLEHELKVLQMYLDIEQLRMQERLTVVKDIDPSLLETLVPNLLLQPLVENAIRHGLNQKIAGGIITISAKKTSDHIQLSIHDTGPGCMRREDEIWSNGIGLNNTRQRLRHLYGDQFTLTFSSDKDQGTEVQITLPLQEEEGRRA